MKQVFILLALLAGMQLRAAEPTTAAYNVSFQSVDGGQFNLSYTAGNGQGRIVVVKSGSDITGVPVDGTVYNASTNSANAPFMAAGTGFTQPNEWVVYRGTASSVTITGLSAGTTYYVAIFEYNGTTVPDYYTVTPANKFTTTLSAPVTAASITGTSLVTGNSARLTFTNGSGQARLVVGRKGAALTATPVNYTFYNATSVFGSATGSSYKLDAETYVLAKATSGSAGQTVSYDVTGLEPNTQYTFAVYEYNGTNAPVYMATGSTTSFTTNAGPTQASSGVSVSVVDGNRLTMSWNRGNGAQTIVVARKGSPVVNVPVNGQTYPATTVFSTSAEWVPNSGEVVISAGTNTSVTLTGLEKATTYYFTVFSYDADANGNTYYLTTILNKSATTAQAPTQARTLSISTITGSTAQLVYGNISAANGSYRMLVIRQDAPITFVPQDYTLYSGGTSNYGVGTPVSAGTYVLYGQTNGGAPNIGSLSPGHTYYVASWDFNGSYGPVYLVPGGSVSFTIPNEPSSAATTPLFPTAEGNSLRFDWTSGNGARRIVIARKGAPVTTMPTDGVTYTAATAMNAGTEMGNGLGEYVVYDNSGSTVTVTGLDPASTYYFAVVEYNPTAGGPDYLTTAGGWLATSKATYGAPTTQVSGLGNGTLTTTTAVINFSVGNGTSRLFVIRAGSPVNIEPTDLTHYSSSQAYMSGYHFGSGNYVIGQGNTTSFTISSLQPGMQYYLAAFEYNGSSGPVYLKPAVTHSFTTLGSTPAPTQDAQTPVIEAVDGNRLTFRWTSGNGTGRIVVARKASAPTFTPVNGTSYTSQSAFSTGTNLGDDQYVVYNGSGNTATITNLEPASTYYFAVYEFNGSGSGISYRTASYLQASGTTAIPPAAESTAPSATPSTSSIQLSWLAGNGTGRIVIARAGSAPTATPATLTKYGADAVFGNGQQPAPGEYVVYSGTGNSVTVTGLAPGTTYHFSIFEFNGTDAPVYSSDFLAMSAATTGTVLPVSWLYLRGRESNGSVRIEWATAQEQNTQHFVVERNSGNGFEETGTVAAAGNSNGTRLYTFTDRQPPTGILHYRLRQVDADGHSHFSATVQVHGKSSAPALLQNPVHGSITVRCGAPGSYSVIDALGRSIARGTVRSGLQILPVANLKPGRYFLQVQQKDEAAQTLSFIAQ